MIKLIQNETIKTIKKTSTKILVILAILALLGAVGFSYLITNLNGMVTNYYTEDGEWQELMRDNITSIKKTLETGTNLYDLNALAQMKAEMETYEIALKYNINYMYYNGFYWKVQALDEIQEAKVSQNLSVNEDEKEKYEKFVTERENLLAKDNYKGYVEALKIQMKQKLDNNEISKDTYEQEIYLLDLQEKYNIFENSETINSWKRQAYQDISVIKKCLTTGINTTTGKLLKEDEIASLEDRLKIQEYRLENDVPLQESGSTARSLYDIFAPAFSLIMISILMIIIAGSSISTEISKGTIKFLLFTPNKRWKVLLSKIISAILILLVLSLVISILSVLIGNICFKDDGTVYVYVQNGNVKVLSNIVYTMLYYLTSSIDILVYMLFGIMLSTITKNTALSVGVSIASYVGSGTIMQIINAYITADWVKFIPFNNLGLADKIFANNLSYSSSTMLSNMANEVSIGFSLAVLGVCCVLMIVTMFDSFNKRDIV